MICLISGTVVLIAEHSIAIDIGSFACDVYTPIPSNFSIGQQVKIPTYLHWNNEQGPTLYGFSSLLDKNLFVLLISCSGIGPKMGLSILADLGATRCIQAVQLADDRTLSKVSGIGAKKAEQLVVNLKHKINTLVQSDSMLAQSLNTNEWHTVTQALESLNYSRTEITRAITHLRGNNKTESSFDTLMRQALSFLSKQS